MRFKFSLLFLILNLSAIAWAGNDGKGGGDMCEDRIKIIRDDIQNWINKNGPRDLKLPTGTSVAQYSSSMLAAISTAKIRCVGTNDEGFPVQYLGTPKVCVFDSSSNQITCDFFKFNATDQSEQYVQVHHEYAGLAEIEQPNGSDSNYAISNQISGYLVNQVVKKLAVKPQSSPQFDDLARNFDGSISYMNQVYAIDYCSSRGEHLPTVRELAQLAITEGAVGISETEQVGYYAVNAKNSDGISDSFYFNSAGYRPLDNALWSSSIKADDTNAGYYLDTSNLGFINPGAIKKIGRYQYKFAVRCVLGH